MKRKSFVLVWHRCLGFLLIAVGVYAGEFYPRPNLKQTAMLLEEDMIERFSVEGQIAPKRRLPSDTVPFVSYNMPDNAYMTGMYLASQTHRWLAERTDEAKQRAREAARALHTFLTVTGKPGLLARAFLPVDMEFHDDGIWRISPDGKYRWRGDVSSDQVDGYLYGCSVYAAHLATDEEIQRMANASAAICTHIEENGMRIVDVDGTPTPWGNYTWEYVSNTEPMNALLWLQHLKVTAQLTGDPRWEEKYRLYAIEKKYAEIAAKAYSGEAGLDGGINHSDIVLHFLAYEPLFRLEKDPDLLAVYQKSLHRSWSYIQKINQPFFTYLYGGIQQDLNLPEIRKATANLKSFTFDIHWNQSTRNRYGEKYRLNLEPEVPKYEPEAGEPIPYSGQAKTWSLLVHDPYSGKADRIPRPDSHMEYTGLHWTVSYWYGRSIGVIEEED